MIPVAITIIGSGDSAEAHINSLTKVPYTFINSIIGRNALKLKKKYDLSRVNTRNKVATPYAFDTGGINLLLICNENNKHYSSYIKSKHKFDLIVIDKPIDACIDNSLKVLRSSKGQNPIPIIIFLQHRFSKNTIYLSQLIKKFSRENILGIEISICMNRGENYYKEKPWVADQKSAGGGVLMHQAIHEIDRVLFATSEKIDKYHGYISNKGKNLTIEDEASISIKTKKNTIITIHATTNSSKNIRNTSRIYLKNGSIVVSENKIEWHDIGKSKVIEHYSSKQTNSGYELMWEKIIGSIRQSSSSIDLLPVDLMSTLSDCYYLQKMIADIYSHNS